MNFIYKALLIFIPAILINSSLSGQPQFQKIYNEEPSVEVLMDQASNGDVFMVADAFNDYDGHRILVQRLNASGDVLQSNAITKIGGYSYRSTNILATSDNKLLVMGRFNEPLVDIDSVFVIKTNTTGDTEWQYNFQFDTDIHDVYGAIETNDGGFIIYGIFERSTEFSSAVFMMKINSAGAKVWSREISSTLDGAFLLVGGILEANNGDLWLSGSTRFNSEGTWAAKLNSVGVIQSVTFYDTHGLTDSQPEPFAMFWRSNGERDIFYNSTSFQDGSVLLNLRTNPAGIPISTSIYSIGHINGGDISAIRSNGTGGYIASGYHFPDGFRASGMVFELNSSDNVLWSKSYGAGYIELVNAVLPMPDGGVLMAGFADPEMVIISPSENGLFPWLVKTGSMGDAECLSGEFPITSSSVNTSSNSYQLNEAAGPDLYPSSWNNFEISTTQQTILCNPTSVIENERSSFNLYPNPTGGLVVIELDSPMPGSTLIVSDLLGETILKQQLDSQEKISLNINAPSGMYLLTINTPEGATNTRKLVKE